MKYDDCKIGQRVHWRPYHKMGVIKWVTSKSVGVVWDDGSDIFFGKSGHERNVCNLSQLEYAPDPVEKLLEAVCPHEIL